jgi:flagellar hook assembly protein FlgD
MPGSSRSGPVPAAADLEASRPPPAVEVPAECSASCRCYDVLGRLVTTLIDEIRPAGPHEIRWSGEDDRGQPVASGTYFYRVQAGAFRETHKVVRTR